MRQWLVVTLMVLGLRVQGWAQTLGVGQPFRETGGELYSDVIPTLIMVVGSALVLSSLVVQNSTVFMTFLIVGVVIFGVGLGLPAMMTRAGWEWNF